MKSPVSNLFKAARLTRKGRTFSAALVLQQMMVPATKPKRKRAETKRKPVKPAATRTATASTRPRRPLPGTFVDDRFTCGHGTLRYRLYTPIGSAGRRMPLVVMLHGCGQSASDFAAGTGMNALADEHGFIVLYPEQPASANLGRCWNWHRPGDQDRDRGEPALIAALTLHAIAAARANPARVYIAGISAGGAAAAIVGAAYPEIFVAVGVHSGVARGEISTLTGALTAMRTGAGASSRGKTARPLPTIIFHGDKDRVVHSSNANGFLTHLQRSAPGTLSAKVEQGQSAGDREYTRTQHRTGAGEVLLEDWVVHGADHAWSGGQPGGSHTDRAGPDASREMIRFFLSRRRTPKTRQKVQSASTKNIGPG